MTLRPGSRIWAELHGKALRRKGDGSWGRCRQGARKPWLLPRDGAPASKLLYRLPSIITNSHPVGIVARLRAASGQS
jgi:hypothetical protein